MWTLKYVVPCWMAVTICAAVYAPEVDDVPDVAAVGGFQFRVELVHVVEVENDGAAAGVIRRDVDVVGRARRGKAAVVEVQDRLRVAGQHPQVGRTRGGADGRALRGEVRGIERAGGGGRRRVIVLREQVAGHDRVSRPARSAGRRAPIQQVADGDVARRARVPRCCAAPRNSSSARRRARATANAGGFGPGRSRLRTPVPGAVTHARRTRLTDSASSEIQSSAVLLAASQK